MLALGIYRNLMEQYGTTSSFGHDASTKFKEHLYFKILNPANPSRYCFHDVVVNTYGRLWFRAFCGSLFDKIKIKLMF